MTNWLAKNITKTTIPSAYSIDMDICNILSYFVGEDNMIKEYFSENTLKEIHHKGKSPSNIFREVLSEKYGMLGYDINNDLKQLMISSDILLKLNRIKDLSGLDEETEKLRRKSMEERHKSIIDAIQKDEKWNLACNYIEIGKVSEEIWNKKPVLHSIIEQDVAIRTMNDISDKISQIKYQQVGEYYMLLCDNMHQNEKQGEVLNGKIFDKDGIELQETILWSSVLNLINASFYNSILQSKLNISNGQDITNLIEQLMKKGKELKGKALLDKKSQESKDYIEIVRVGNLFKIQYIPNIDSDNNICCEFYSLNSNGELEQVEQRREKKVHR